MTTLLDNFDADLLQSTIDSNLDYAYEATNTCEYDIDELTIIDALPSNEDEGQACHLSLLSRYATDDRTSYDDAIIKHNNMLSNSALAINSLLGE